MTPQPHPPSRQQGDEAQAHDEAPANRESDHDPLYDVEASLNAIHGLFEAVYELSAVGNPRDRKLSAICAVSSHLLDETIRAKEALQLAFEKRR